MATIPGIVRIGTSSAGAATNPNGNMTSHQPNPSEITKTKEYYVKVPKSKKTFHALKFNSQVIDFSTIAKAEMVRDTTNQPPQRQDWDNQPKQGEGSEYNKEAKEAHRLKRLGFVSKRGAVDLPWIVRGVDKEKSKERQFIGKKSITENSSYFIFIKCPDGGGFEAHPLEDWYTFAPYKTYKALNAEEAEEEFKRRHKTLNKLMIMANKRKNEVEGGANDLEDDEIDQGKKKDSNVSKATSLISAMYQKESPTKAGNSRNKKASRLSDDEDDIDSRKVKKPVVKKKKKQDDDEDGEDAVQEDSDDGDHEGREKDYDSTDEESEEEPDTEKYEEKYGQKGVDEEEAIKSLEKETDDEEEDKKTDEDDDEDLTEQGKEYKKLMSKNDDENGDELDEFIKTGKMGGDDSKESSSSFDEADLDDEKPGKGSKGKKRKAGDGLSGGPQIKSSKKSLSASRGMQSTNLQNHDESSSSSTSSQTGKAMMTKSSKTAAIIASVNRQKQQQGSNTSMSESRQTPGTSSTPGGARSIASVVSEEEVRKYLSRKLMTAKELLKKFRAKTQNAFSDQELCDRLKIILDKMNVQFKTVDNKNYLALP